MDEDERNECVQQQGDEVPDLVQFVPDLVQMHGKRNDEEDFDQLGRLEVEESEVNPDAGIFTPGGDGNAEEDDHNHEADPERCPDWPELTDDVIVHERYNGGNNEPDHHRKDHYGGVTRHTQ